MKCKNHYCIYWRSGVCMKNEIYIDAFGKCSTCLYAIVDSSFSQDEIRTLLEKNAK